MNDATRDFLQQSLDENRARLGIRVPEPEPPASNAATRRTATARERFVITLEVMPHRIAGVARLRRALKVLLRGFGLKCVGIESDRRPGMSAALVPFRFAIDADALLRCPVCGYEWVHLARVTVDQGHTRAVCHADRVDVSGKPPAARGSSVELTAWCESGHEFTYRFAFHKGQTSVELSARDAEIVRDDVTELWRD